MIFEFIDKRYFYINDELKQTDSKGHFELSKEECSKILTQLGKSKDLDEKTAYAFLYQHLLSRQVSTFQTVVKAAGNSARIPISPKYIDEEVKVWVAFLGKVRKE